MVCEERTVKDERVIKPQGLAAELRPRGRAVAATGLVVALATVMLLGGRHAASAQVSVIEPEGHFESYPTQDFLTINGQRAAVGYLPGSLDRAHHVLARLDNLAAYFRRWRPDLPVPLAAYAVDREQWGKIDLPGLYGLPLRTGPSSIFVPAQGDPEMTRMFRSALGLEMLPMVPGVPVTGTPEQAASLAIADVLTQIEAARGFAVAAGLQGTDGWVQEVAACVAALVVFRQSEPQREPEIHDLFVRLRERMGGPGSNPAFGFTQLLQQGSEAEIKSWLWYQAVFFEAAELIVAKDGRKSISRLNHIERDGRGRLQTAALVKRYPGLTEWQNRWFSADARELSVRPPARGR